MYKTPKESSLEAVHNNHTKINIIHIEGRVKHSDSFRSVPNTQIDSLDTYYDIFSANEPDFYNYSDDESGYLEYFSDLWVYMLINNVEYYEFRPENEITLDQLEKYYTYAFDSQDKAYEKYLFYRNLISTSSVNYSCKSVTEYSGTSYITNPVVKLSLVKTTEEMDNYIYKKEVIESECSNIIDYLYRKGYLSDALSDKEKALAVYKFIDYSYHYDETYNNSTAYDLVTYGSATCNGYTSLYNYILNKLGLRAEAQFGTAGDSAESHVWTKIEENGTTYYIDVTWGDPLPDKPYYSDESWFWLTYDEMIYLDPNRVFSAKPSD